MSTEDRAKEALPDAKIALEADEGFLRIDDDKVVMTVHDGLGLRDEEIARSDVDNVSFTRSTFRDVGMVTVSGKGGRNFSATIPLGKSKQVVQALARVEEDAEPKTAAAAEKRVTKPAESRSK